MDEQEGRAYEPGSAGLMVGPEDPWDGDPPAGRERRPDGGPAAGIPPMPLTPAARLRPDHLGGFAVRLLDGAEWLFPDPTIEFAEDGSRPDGIRTVSNISPAFDAALNDLEDAQEGLLHGPPADESDVDRTRRLMAQNRRLRGQSLKLAGEMLRRNYRLTIDETARLVRWRAAGADELYRAIMDIAQGVTDRPKLSGPGSPSASGPTA